jgi:hypothetical protein
VARKRGGPLLHRVRIESDAGTVVARYEMIEIEGSWRAYGPLIEAEVLRATRRYTLKPGLPAPTRARPQCQCKANRWSL